MTDVTAARARTKLARTLAIASALACGVTSSAGCKKKNAPHVPAAEVTGLAAVPADAEVVIGVEVGRLAASPIIERAVTQLLSREGQLARQWEQLRDACKIDLATQVKRIMLARGPAADAAAAPPRGSGDAASASRPTAGAPLPVGPVLLVATGVEGAITETDLATCIRSVVGKGGGSLTAKPAGGRTLYQVKEGSRTVFFAFGRADTIVLSTSEPYLVEALGTGKKAPDHPELAAWLKLTNQNAPLWGVGRVSPRVRQGLTKVAAGLQSGPLAFAGTADLTDGAKLALTAVMSSSDDAKQLETLAKGQLVAASMWAQMKSLGELVQKVTVTADGSNVQFKADLSMEQVNQLLSVLDAKPPPEQDSPPASPGASGSGSPASSSAPPGSGSGTGSK